jgi:hypothetical protein
VHAKATRTFDALDGLLERGIADHRKRRRGGPREGDGSDDDVDSRRSFVSVLLDVKEEEETGELLFDTVAVKVFVLVCVLPPSQNKEVLNLKQTKFIKKIASVLETKRGVAARLPVNQSL